MYPYALWREFPLVVALVAKQGALLRLLHLALPAASSCYQISGRTHYRHCFPAAFHVTLQGKSFQKSEVSLLATGLSISTPVGRDDSTTL